MEVAGQVVLPENMIARMQADIMGEVAGITRHCLILKERH